MPVKEWRKSYDGAPCPYCGITMRAAPRDATNRIPKRYPTRDHVIPQHRGGVGALIVCWQCNNDKGGLTLAMWLAVLAFRKDPRAAIIRAIVDANPGYQE